MHSIKQSPTPQKIAEHANRKAWNEHTIVRLGLILIKTDGQTKSMAVWQGNFRVYYDWTSLRDANTNCEMHKSLESFLKRYLKHITAFEGVAELMRLN